MQETSTLECRQRRAKSSRHCWAWAFLQHIPRPKSKREHDSLWIFEESEGSGKASTVLELTSCPLLRVLHADPPEKSLHDFWVYQVGIAPQSEKLPQTLLRDGGFITEHLCQVHLTEFRKTDFNGAQAYNQFKKTS